jgi:hypothetical protein
MKKLILAITVVLFTATHSSAQNIHWKSLDKDQNVIQLNIGYDFGFTTQIGYYRMISFYRPILLGVNFSLPMGSDLVDDFKVGLTSQTEIVEADGFSFSVMVASNFRRYQNDFVRSVGFGADFAAIAGYYSDKWHAAAEFGFDKAITTNLIHSDVMRSYYPDIQDGWYVPTGGHFYYGIQAGKTLSERVDLGLRFGATRAQLHDDNAVLPYYLQLGVGTKI